MRTNRRKFLQATGTAGLLLTTAPLSAMAAARTRQPDLAPDFLLLDTPKNRYLPNGHNFQRAYLPANGGLLAVTAMMSAG